MFSQWNENLYEENSRVHAGKPEGAAGSIPAFRENNGLRSVQQEFANFRQRLPGNHSADDDNAGWSWFCEKLAYFKSRKLEPKYFSELCTYAVTNFPGQYAVNFEAFLEIIERLSYITDACKYLLRENRMEEALAAAKPCMAYLKARTDRYAGGQLCFASMEEAVLYAAEKGDSGENSADENYAAFFLCYANIMLKRVSLYRELGEDAKHETAFCLDHSEKLSPCNASLWELRSRTFREADQKKYMECIHKALLYSVPDGSNDVLGETYANLAFYYSARDYALANALCVLSKKYGGDPSAAEAVMSGCHYEPYLDAEITVHQAGIQVGYSSLARMAMEKAQEYRLSAGQEEKLDKSRKLILSAANAAYQYEIRDPMTIVGRSSAMSEYLKMKPTVSRVHARLVQENDQLFVSDMDTVNGTYVNGIRIGSNRQVLREGDELRLGSSSERGARFTIKRTK